MADTSDITPIITDHARERCAQMGISTKVAKRMVRRHDIAYAGNSLAKPALVLMSDAEPDIAVVVTMDYQVVITVLLRTEVQYDRDDGQGGRSAL